MILKNLKDTKRFAKSLIRLIKRYLKKKKKLVILFQGHLGAGKTTIIKEIAKNLKIPYEIKSPTFILWQIYPFKIFDKNYFLHHIDLYRINPEDLLKINLKKQLKSPYNLFVIEWGEKIIKFLKQEFLLIEIKKTKKQQREIKVELFTKNGRKAFIN
ncbi:MAG: tRNA (adenosine(37)-N6)-threonylcarbamoyltransferase complex ATPase subunit type 1 TsaE [Minisyncoccia bacterium]|jgi:tRNA threonylcarbamoyladenosine biosynthesis protein TsaE